MAGLADVIRRFLGESPNDPVANHERNFGMTGGELGPRTGHHGYGQSYRPNPNYIPSGSSPSMNMDWSKVRATQRPGYEREPSPYDESAITKLAEGRTVGFEDFAFPKNEKMPDAVQRQEGMGLNNIAGRHGSFPLTKPPFGASGTLDTVLPEMGYDYTNEGYDFATPELGSMGHDYTNEGYAGLSSPVATPRPSEMGGQHAGWQTPGPEPVSVDAYEDRDLSAYAGERTDWTTPQIDAGPTIEPGGELYPGHKQAAMGAGAGGILGLLSGRHGKWIDQNKAKMRGYGIEPSHRTEAGELTGRYSSEDWKRLQAAMGG